MFCHEVLSDFNCFQPASVQTFIDWSGCEKFSTRSLGFCNRFSCARINRRCGCHYQQVCLREKCVGLLCHNKSPCVSLVDTALFTPFWKPLRRLLSWLTEMIVRKTVSIVSPSAQKCIDNFPPPLLLSVPRDNGLVARKNCVSAFSEFYHHRFSDSISFSSWSFFVSGVPLCFWPKSKEWPTSFWKSSCE